MIKEFSNLIKSNIIISLYFITLFLLCVCIISIAASIFSLMGDTVALLITGTVVFVVVGGADILLIVTGHWSLSVIFWIIPVFIWCMIKARFKKQDTLEYDLAMPKNIAYSAMEHRYKRLQKC